MAGVTLPDWLTPDVLLHHKTTGTIFTASHCGKRGKAVVVLDAPKGSPGNEYPLAECEPATPAHCTGGNPFVWRGTPGTIIRLEHGWQVYYGRWQFKILPAEQDEVYQAAQSLAEFFNGTVLPGEVLNAHDP